MKKFMAVCIGLLIAFGSTFFWLFVRPLSIAATSPDGTLMAKVNWPNFFGLRGKVRVTVQDLKTGETKLVEEREPSAMFGGDCWPEDIIWSPKSNGFVFVYSGEVIGSTLNVFEVAKSPLRSNQSFNYKKWVIPLMHSRAKSSDPATRDLARNLLEKLSWNE